MMEEGKPKRSSALKKAIVVSSAVFLIIVVMATLRANLVSSEVPHETVPPRVSFIVATLDPPFTEYRVFTGDLDEDQLTFTWSLTGHGGCSDFTFRGPTARWMHDGEACPHLAAQHPGTIAVRVKGGGHVVERVYEGGSAPHEPDPLYPPEPLGGQLATNGTNSTDRT